MGILKSSLHFCVLIPCFNDAAGLLLSLKSIQYNRSQFLVVVVDDGSMVPVAPKEIAAALGADFPFHIIRLPKNSGITEALNTGLQWILQNTDAPFIARLDCRDICTPERFYKQVTFLNTHAPVGLLGSWCIFKEEGTPHQFTYKTPQNHKQIVKAMHGRNVFIHPTVMFRTAVLQQAGLYPFDYPHAEDYALFWKMLQVTEGAILSEYLVTCAITRNGISLKNRRMQLNSRYRIVKHLGSKTLWKQAGLIKIKLLMIVPKTVVLQLKAIINK